MLNQLFGSNKPPVDLTEGLVAHYLFNNNADDSSGTYDGTQNNGVDFQGDGARFDGVDDEIETSYYLNSANYTDEPFTISTWFYRSGISGAGSLITADSAVLVESANVSNTEQGLALAVDFDNNDIDFFLITQFHTNRIAKYNVPAIANLSVGFHNITISYDGSKTLSGMKIYCDKVLLSGGLTATDGTYIGMLRFPMNFGRNLPLTNDYYRRFNGLISNTRVYNDVKNQTFIDGLFAEGYYPKPLPLPTTDGLIAHYPLTGTAEDTTGNYDSTEVSATYKDDAEFGSVYDGGGSITINTTATGLAVWCCYWIDTGTGWVFTKTTTIPSTLTANAYRNLRLYSLTPSLALQDEIEEYEKNFRPIDIDDGLVAYYPLANNSLDNYYNEYDGVDTDMTYDGLSGVFNGATSKIVPPLVNTLNGDMSISLWATVNDLSTIRRFFYYQSTVIPRAFILHAYSDGVIQAYLHGGTAGVVGTEIGFLGLDTIFNLIATIKGNTVSMYIDGVLIGSSTVVSPTYITASPLSYIGVDKTLTDYFHSGKLSKFRAYNKAISAEQVAVIYNTEKGDFI